MIFWLKEKKPMPHHGAKSSFSAKRDFVYVKHHFFLKNDTPPTQNHNFLSGLPLETLPEKPCGGDRNSGFVSAMCCPHIWPGLAATVLNRIRLRPAPGRQVLEQAAAEICTGGSPDFMMCVAVALLLPRQTGICHI